MVCHLKHSKSTLCACYLQWKKTKPIVRWGLTKQWHASLDPGEKNVSLCKIQLQIPLRQKHVTTVIMGNFPASPKQLTYLRKSNIWWSYFHKALSQNGYNTHSVLQLCVHSVRHFRSIDNETHKHGKARCRTQNAKWSPAVWIPDIPLWKFVQRSKAVMQLSSRCSCFMAFLYMTNIDRYILLVDTCYFRHSLHWEM